ncbi:MAG: asparagine synthetase B, partial [Magnetospirillum sp.]|nr:asparagine synthetase B [Magnetospirillum sp.]
RLPHPRQARPRKQADLAAEFLALVEDAVRVRMVADVPVGALLSGGVDSSTVVAMMARMSGRPIKTFSVGFDEPGYDETAYARQVADHVGSDHHVLRLGPDCTDILPKLAWHYGEPFADPSAIATTLVSEFARREVTVVLNGDGGDESMLGYPRYQRALEWSGEMNRPGRLAARLLAHLPLALQRGRIGRKLGFLAAKADERASRRYAPSLMYFQENEKPDAYGAALRPFLDRSSLDLIEPYFTGIQSGAAGAAWADLHTYLPDDLLVKVDVASMAFGLEARSPLLDHPLMEWAALLPAEQKMWGGETKALFKAAIEPLLPREVIYRPKMGFGVPVDRWLQGPLKPLAYDLLTSERFRARGLIRPDWMEWALEANSSGRATLWHRIWALMVMELWYRTWIDPATSPV